MKEKYKIEEIKNTIIHGDSLEELKKIPDESIDLVITSPPYYGLRNYQVEEQIGLENTLEDYLEKMLKITAELKRVLKKSGQLWWNHGDCYGGQPAGNKIISEANIGEDGLYVRKMKMSYGAKSKIKPAWEGKENLKTSTLTNPEYNLKRGRAGNQKCMMMQPERLAIRMIDEQGWILRNKVVWAKQVLIKKENKTIGSVMPTSVKDRFNESWEYLYYFVKNKKYYSDLDAVRITPTTQPWGKQTRIKGGTGSWLKTDYFNYRVRDAERKAGHPQCKATKEEIERYKKETGKIKGGGANTNLSWNLITGGKIYRKRAEEKLSRGEIPSPIEMFALKKEADDFAGKIRNWRKEEAEGYKMGSVDPHRAALRGGLKYYKGKFSGMGKEAEKYGSPRARAERKTAQLENLTPHGGKNYEYGGINSPNSSFKKKVREGYVVGKNIPTVWQINPEPHNFRKELGVDVDHFAVFPEALVEIPIKFGCPKDGIVLDPFAGSGTSLVMAKKLGRNYIGIELNKDYIKIAEARIKATQEPIL